MISPEDRFRFVSEVGFEAFQLIESRMKELGDVSFAEWFPCWAGAGAVCFANLLRPAIEAAGDRAAAADKLVASCSAQVRALVEPVVGEG